MSNHMSVKKEKRPFLKRHKRWFSYLGTIVVLGTFVVNEALRNDSKDLADSIDRAQNTFTERSEIQQVIQKLDEIERSNQSIRNYQQFKGRIPLDTQLYKRYPEDVVMADVEYPIYLRYVSVADNIASLYEKLPYDQQLDETHWTIDRILKEEYQYLHHTWNLRYAMDVKDVTLERQMREEIAKDNRIRDQEKVKFKVTITEAIDNFGATVLDRARTARKAAEEKYRKWKTWSFVLYPLGLFFGLMGKIYGDEESVAEEI